MKLIILIALLTFTAFSKSPYPLTIASGDANYQQRYELITVAGGTITFKFTFPVTTGAAPTTFRYEVLAADGTTNVHGPVTLNIATANPVTDATWTTATATTTYILKVDTT